MRIPKPVFSGRGDAVDGVIEFFLQFFFEIDLVTHD